MSGWGRPYVTAAQRQARAKKAVAAAAKKGKDLQPVRFTGRKIAKTFWGQAWCDNLAHYSDYASRLPRGSAYLRNGSVIHLAISAGHIEAQVSGTRLYKVSVKVAALEAGEWAAIKAACAGQITSLVSLVEGRLSPEVMQTVSKPGGGLFPRPKEIALSCTCPDWATLCKHVAATLYGVGVRLDESPELLFELRGVDPSELITAVFARGDDEAALDDRWLDPASLARLFGEDIDFSDEALPEALEPGADGAAGEAKGVTAGPRPAKKRRPSRRSTGKQGAGE